MFAIILVRVCSSDGNWSAMVFKADTELDRPKRYTEMPCNIEDIPIIDAVIISHNHYDHLSHPTVTKIARLHPNCHFFAPLGNKQWFLDSGIENCTELDWWEERDLTLSALQSSSSPEVTKKEQPDSKEGVDTISGRIGCLPCQHISARGFTDRSKTLWGSWSIESGGQKVWFGGYELLFPLPLWIFVTTSP